MNEMNEETPQLEIVSNDALASIERATIDMQVATAKKYPRSISKFIDRAMSMIAADKQTAEECNYLLKRKDKGGGTKYIKGPSIRLMEIAAACWTNIRYGSRVIAEDNQFVTTQGVSHDLENNVAVSVEIRRRITYKDGSKYSEDMVAVTANAAGSIARRNALNGVIPRAYVNKLAAYAEEIVRGDIKSLPERRQKAFDYFGKGLGVDADRVLAFLEKPKLEDVDLEDVEKLNALKTALKDGETSLEEAFPKWSQEDAGEQETKPERRRRRTKAEMEAARKSGQKPEPEAPTRTEPLSLQDQLANLVTGMGYTFDEFIGWSQKEELFVTDAGSFDEVEEAICKRMLNAKQGLVNGLKQFTGR